MQTKNSVYMNEVLLQFVGTRVFNENPIVVKYQIAILSATIWADLL